MVLNDRIFIRTGLSDPLEYLEDFYARNKKFKMQEFYLKSHRGRDALYNVLKLEHYNIKISDINDI